MRPTFYGFEIAKTGLFMSQKNLDVTGHNIANAQTPGYTRQRLITSNIPPYNTMTRLKDPEVGKVGAGVEALSLDQIRNLYLDRRIRNHNAVDSYWSARDTGLGEIEAIVNGEIGASQASLSQLTTSFFQAFNRLCIDEGATDKELRTNLVNAARQLTDGLHDVYTRLQELQMEHDLKLSLENGGYVAQVNLITTSIVDLNRQIYAFEVTGESALDLRDQRNLLLDELSTLVDIEYYEDINNKLHVSVGGREMIYHKEYMLMECSQEILNPFTGEFDLNAVCWEDGARVTLTGGTIKAVLDLRDGVKARPAAGIEARNGVAQYVEMLNELAQQLSQKVNELHVQGWTLPQAEGEDSLTGILFFRPDVDDNGAPILDANGQYTYSNVNAGNIGLFWQIDPDQHDPQNIDNKGSIWNIAVSDTKVSPPPYNNGENETANQNIGLLIVELGLKDGISQGAITGFIQSFLVTIGSDKRIANARATEYQSISYELSQMWASYSGVSNDEEMTNLIRFNHAYTAASRNITAIDEQLDVLINRTGRVGL